VASNIGKTLGSYATHWGRLPIDLIVIDEVPPRTAHFASLGSLCNNVVPVSFFGMHSP
jgi:ethanolamine utilization protein EutA